MAILMPKATALWLIDNTALSFVQIGDFVGLHELEVKTLADGEGRMQGESPIQSGLLTQQEIDRCVDDPASRLKVDSGYQLLARKPRGGRRYTPILKRANKPNAIAWLVREYPEMSDAQIGRLVGSTKSTIAAIRNRTHWNISSITPASPVELGLCSLNEMQKAIDNALKTRREKEAEAQASRETHARETHARETHAREIHDGEQTVAETGSAQQAIDDANNLFA